MKKLIAILVLFCGVFCFAAYKNSSQVLMDMNKDARAVTSIATKTMSASWTNLGNETPVYGYSTVGLWVVVSNASTADFRVRALAKHTSAGASFNLPIKTGTVANTIVNADYIEFATDQDQNVLIPFELDRLVNYIQFQYQVGTVGTNVGSVSASITKGWK